MDILKSVGGWAKQLTEVGISVIALGVVLEVLFGGAVPFLGDFPLPIEVIPMARSFVSREIIKHKGQPIWRENFITDNGNEIIDVHNLKNIFKGSSVNEEKGESINVTWKIKEIDSDLVCFSINDMKRMKANPGDLVFVEDSRWWLGGLKSAHCIYGEPHNEDGLVYITNKHLSHGQFIEGLKLKAEKEM